MEIRDLCKRQRYAFPDFAGCLSFQSGQGKEYNDFNNLAGSPDDVFTRFQLLADAHIHITRENCRAMLDHMDSLGIDRALLMAFDEESAEVNFDLAREHPQRFLADCNVSSTPFGRLEDRLYSYKERGAAGLGEFMVNRRIDDPYIQRVFAICQELEFPVTFHMSPEAGYSYGIVDDAGLPLLEDALRRFPRLILIGHSQSFWIEFSADVPHDREGRNSWGCGPVAREGRVFQLMDEYENLWCDLSAGSGSCAIMRDHDRGLDFIHRFSDRLLFATDMTGPDMVFPLHDYLADCLAEGELSQAEEDRIFHGNFERLFGKRQRPEQ